MANEQLIDRAERALHKTYNRFPVVSDYRQGVKPYGTEGNEYLDFGTGIAVIGLGYGNGEYTKAVEEQLRELTHISNLFHNQPTVKAEEKLLKVSRMDKVFFINSGTEAIEGALKTAKRHYYNKLHESMGDGAEGCEDVDADMTGEIVAMNHSFHGRSLGTLSITGSAHYQEPPKPLAPGIHLVDFNNLDSVKTSTNDKTYTVTMETIQGEGGIYPAEKGLIEDVRALCDEYDLLLVLGEIRCGMGRSDEMPAWRHYGVKPDVMTVVKAFGDGLPVGAFLARGRAVDTMVPGDYETTYGGNPLAIAGASAVLDPFEKRHMVEHVRKIGAYLAEKLDGSVNESDVAKERRGMGLTQGLEFTGPVGLVMSGVLSERRLVLTSAGADIIRFVPPLVIREEDVDEVIPRLRRAIKASS